MIRRIRRHQLDIQKYNRCVNNSWQFTIAAKSWYLDTVADDWSVLVLNDYEAVMPLPVRRKFLISYVYPPLWVLQLGIFSKEIAAQDEFFKKLKKEFCFVETRLNPFHKLDSTLQFMTAKTFQKLDLSDTIDEIRSNYRKDRKKDIKKAQESQLSQKWNDNTESLIELFKNNVGLRTPEIKEVDYQNLKNLINTCIQKGVGEVLSIYDSQKNLVASAFILKDNLEVTILCSSTDFKNRNNGANTYLIDCLIEKFQSDFDYFNFGGSSISSIRSYFLSFGAKDVKYPLLRMNNLPRLIRFLKR